MAAVSLQLSHPSFFHCFARYTEWVDFNTKTTGAPDWDRVVGKELYNHSDDPMENKNLAASAEKRLLSALSALLHQHPVAGLMKQQ